MLKFSLNLKNRKMKTTLQGQTKLKKILRNKQKEEIGKYWSVVHS